MWFGHLDVVTQDRCVNEPLYMSSLLVVDTSDRVVVFLKRFSFECRKALGNGFASMATRLADKTCATF